MGPFQKLQKFSVPGHSVKASSFHGHGDNQKTYISNCPNMRTTALHDPRLISMNFVTSTESNCFITFSNNDWRTLCLKYIVIKWYFGKISWFLQIRDLKGPDAQSAILTYLSPNAHIHLQKNVYVLLAYLGPLIFSIKICSFTTIK